MLGKFLLAATSPFSRNCSTKSILTLSTTIRSSVGKEILNGIEINVQDTTATQGIVVSTVVKRRQEVFVAPFD
jgi:hypothetical protein